VIAGVLALTSCATVSSDAARVGDASISASDFEAVLVGVGDVSPDLLQPSGAYNGSSARSLLTGWITTEVLRDDLERRGIEVTDADRAATEEQLATDPSWAGASEAVREFFIEVNTVQAVFERETSTSDAELAARYADGPAAIGVACLRALIVETEDEASDALARLEAGEEFADVAADVSFDASAADGGVLSDPNTGLPCLDWPTFELGADPALVESLAGAAPDETVGPVPIEAGVVLAQVRPYDEVADAVRTLVAGRAATEAQTELVRSADPWVSSRFGRWSATNGAVVGLR
jgi:hypothetical protein